MKQLHLSVINRRLVSLLETEVYPRRSLFKYTQMMILYDARGIISVDAYEPT